MKRSIAIPVVLLLFSSHVTANEIKWKDLPLDIDQALKTEESHYGIAMIAKSKDKKFSMTMRGEIILNTREKGGKVFLQDSTVFKGRTMQLTTISQKNKYLSPSSISAKYIRNGKTGKETNMRIHDGKGVINKNGKTETLDYPENTITLTGLMRFIPQIPKKQGTVILLPAYTNSFEIRIEKPSKEKPIKLNYQGLTDIQYRNKPTKAHTYHLNTRRPYTFFVSQDNKLIQFKQGNNTLMALLSADEVKQIAAENSKKEAQHRMEESRIKNNIHELAWRGRVREMEALLAKKPTLANSQDNNGEYPVHRAATFGKDKALSLLLKYKAGVNKRNNFGRTALHNTVPFGKLTTAKILVAAGADPNIKDNFGQTALDMAKEKKKTAMVDYLQPLGEKQAKKQDKK